MVNAKVLIFDLDGTAIPSRIDGMPSEALCRQVVSNAELYFCAATGRSWQHAKLPIQALGLTAPCVISGGTQIINPVTEQVVWEVIIPETTVEAIRSIAKKYGKNLAYVAGLHVTESISADTALPAEPINTTYMFNILPNELQEVLDALHACGEINAALTRSWFREGVTDLHITHKNATKEHAIIQLCSLLGVSKQHAIGVGDGHNDLHLFNAVGTKIAMGNAETELKKAADRVIDGIEEDGLATFISELKENSYDPFARN